MYLSEFKAIVQRHDLLDHYCEFQINDKFVYIFKGKAEEEQKEEVGYN